MPHYPTHDDFFAASMRYPVIARDFLKNYLSPIILKSINLKTLNRVPDTFAGRRQNHLVDVLYTVNMVDEQGKDTGEEALLWIIFEHKSAPDRFLPLQLDRYRTEIWEMWRKQRKKGKQSIKHLPPIWPIVVYHGTTSPYPYSTNIRDLFEDQALARSMFDEGYQLIDLTQISDDDLKKQGMAAGFQLLQKHIRDRENWQFLEDFLLNVVKPIAHEIGDEYLLDMLQYLTNRGKIDDRERFEQLVVETLPEYEGEFMSIAQQWKEQGKQQRDREIARRMLTKGQEPQFVSDMTGLPADEVEQLLNEEQHSDN